MRTKKALYNIVTNLFLQLTVIVYGFIIPKIIISNYGSNVNGLISSITQFLNYISLIEAGFGGVVQYLLYKPIAKRDVKSINDILAASQKFFRHISFVFVMYIIALCFIYPLIINSNFNKWFTISLIIIISINIFSEYYFGLVYKIYLFADQKKYIVSLISIFTYLLNIIVLVILSKINVSIHILKLASTLLFTIRPIFQNFYVRRKYKINLKKGDKNYIIHQKWDALAQHIATVIHNSTDVTILTIFCDLAEVSVYSIYYMIVSGIRKLVSIFYDSINSGFGDIIARKEEDKLKFVFNITESLYYTILSIIFSCTLLLITPFVCVYTKGINDASYIRPLFGYLIVMSEIIWAIRLPYSSVTLSAGHYKETRLGAIIECIINVVISIVLVSKYSIIGVAVGTLIAMLVRTCEFIFHASKYILNRSICVSIKKIVLLIIEMILIILLYNLIPSVLSNNYIYWIIKASIALSLSVAITLSINTFFYKNEFSYFIKELMIIKIRRSGK